jgi:drug/metabolite transporter (DMT)-like permease
MEHTKKQVFSGPLLIVIAALLWGLDGVLRRSLYSLPPITIVFLEHLVGFLILLPFVFKSFGRVKLSRKEWAAIIFVSLLSGLLGTLWFTTALLRTAFISFSVVFLLQKLQPIFAITTARIFLKEKLDRRYVFWALLAVVSAYFVTFPNGVVNFKTGAGTIVAALFAVGAAFAWGTSTTFSKIALTDKPTNYITSLRFLFTIIFAFVGVLILGKFRSIGTLGSGQIWTLVIIALSSGMVSLLIYYRGLKTTPVAVSTILELFYPLVAVFIDVVVYKNVLAISQYVAAAVLLYAMYRVGKIAMGKPAQVVSL